MNPEANLDPCTGSPGPIAHKHVGVPYALGDNMRQRIRQVQLAELRAESGTVQRHPAGKARPFRSVCR